MLWSLVEGGGVVRARRKLARQNLLKLRNHLRAWAYAAEVLRKRSFVALRHSKAVLLTPAI